MSLKQTASDVLELLDRGSYEVDGETVSIGEAQRFAVENTTVYTPDEIETLRDTETPEPASPIRLVDGTTQVVARQMVTDSPESTHIGVLNFASARNPGGGFLRGAKAQEEDLCRCSGLYSCLTPCLSYYQANRKQASMLYLDYMIYSPGVPFFKLRGTGDLLAEPFCVSIITAPAPNSGPFLEREPNGSDKLREAFLRRWRNVLCLARKQKVERLLLGAWGCGAFGGDPVMASETAREAITTHGGGFDEIVFAIPSRGKQSLANLKAFCRTFDADCETSS